MTTQANPRRRMPLRFSLRVLLVAVTAFAIGFPIWYRWPYEEEDLEFRKRASGPQEVMQRFVTWQRHWGGGRKQHGPERILENGRVASIATYRDGQQRGPHSGFDSAGRLIETGEYAGDKRVGAWKDFDPSGRLTRQREFRNGLFWRLTNFHPNGDEWSVEFNNASEPDRIVLNGVQIEDRLARLAAAGRIDNARVQKQVGVATNMEFVETPLKDAIDFLATQHEIPMALDPWHVDAEHPLTNRLSGLPLSTALCVLFNPHDLACDYRYGSIWVTSAEDAHDWRDPTGVADLVPPEDSQLARSWNEPVVVEAIDQPLAEVIEGLVGRLAIAVDTSLIQAGEDGNTPPLVTRTLQGIPFKHVLGILLYQTRCRCRLEGETLVILPPE